MEEVSLVHFLIENRVLLPVVFPTGKGTSYSCQNLIGSHAL